MKNGKVARILLWLIIVITLAPLFLQWFIPGVPTWVVGFGMMYAAICAILLLPENEKKAQFTLWVKSHRPYFPVLVAATFLLRSFIKGFPEWISWAALIIVIPCIVLVGTPQKEETV